MKLIIGGFAQGKLDYVLSKYELKEGNVWDAALPDKQEILKMESGGCVVINRFHQWVRECMSRGGCPQKELDAFLERCKNCVIISDEVGNGIVPADSFEREYREQAGRLLIRLAQKAEGVERVICGIGQKIK